MISTNPRRTLRILVENRHGALLKIVGVFTTRAYNIDSLNVAPDQGEEMSQMTVTVRCDEKQIDELRKQLMKIVDVIDVRHEMQGEQLHIMEGPPMVSVHSQMPPEASAFVERFVSRKSKHAAED